MPERTLLLDLTVEEGRRRIGARDGGAQDRMEREPDAFFEKVRAGYLDLAAAHPGRFTVIDAASSEAEVESAIAKSLDL